MESKIDHIYTVSSPAIPAEFLGDLEENDTFKKKEFCDEIKYSAMDRFKRNLRKTYCAPCIAISKYCWKTLGVMFLVLAVVLITIEMAADINFCYFTPVVPLDIIPMSTPRDSNTPQKRFAISLIGDSMLLDAEDEYSLSSKIFQFLPDYRFNLTVHANRAVRMKNLKEKFLNGKYTKENPDGFIIMADSDITDLPLVSFDQEKQHRLLSNYSRTLVQIIEHIVELKKWVAVASPCGVLLEAPYFSPPKSSRFHSKETYLNMYTTATKLAAEQMNIPYIDIRTPSLQAIPNYRVAYKGCVTRDGEHANDYGTIIMANKFSIVINDWLASVTTAKPKPPRTNKDGITEIEIQ